MTVLKCEIRPFGKWTEVRVHPDHTGEEAAVVREQILAKITAEASDPEKLDDGPIWKFRVRASPEDVYACLAKGMSIEHLDISFRSHE